jgi:tetratricopeptide (TPR) repeat protein
MFERLAWIQRQNHELTKAENNLRTAVELQNALAQRFPNSPFHLLMKAKVQDGLADVLMEEEKWEDSRQLLESSIKLFTKEIGNDDNLRRFNFILADKYARLAKALRALDELALAAQADRQAGNFDRHRPRGRPASPRMANKWRQHRRPWTHAAAWLALPRCLPGWTWAASNQQPRPMLATAPTLPAWASLNPESAPGIAPPAGVALRQLGQHRPAARKPSR